VTLPRRSVWFAPVSGASAESVQRLARFAARSATEVGRWLAAERARRRSLGARAKAVGDPVTDLDVAGEELLRARILRRWPGHGFVGEETGTHEPGRAHVWIVDPIDGTANFAAGLSPWGVSVACLRDGLPVAGAIYLSPEDVTVVAARRQGTRIGRIRVAMPPRTRLDAGSIVGVQWFRGLCRVPFLSRLLASGARVRVFGSTVVQLCDVARGRLDANVQQQGRVWDIAAGALVVEEAGGAFTRWDGRPVFPCTPADFGAHHASVAAWPALQRKIVRSLALPVSRA